MEHTIRHQYKLYITWLINMVPNRGNMNVWLTTRLGDISTEVTEKTSSGLSCLRTLDILPLADREMCFSSAFSRYIYINVCISVAPFTNMV